MSKTYYAVRDVNDGKYFDEYYEGSTIDDAKLWKTRRGAQETSDDWGSMLEPKSVNEVVEVEVVETRTIKS